MGADCNDRANIKVKRGITTALGVTIYNEGVNFAVAVEEGIACKLAIYCPKSEKPFITIELNENEKIGDIYSVFLEKLEPAQYEYIYFLDDKIYLDPYAKQITGKEEWGQAIDFNKIRGVINFEEYNWDEDKPLQIHYHQVIMYSLHVRGFTKHSRSKVKNKGTFEGIIEKIPYLKELGINQIKLMPAYEFDEIISMKKNDIDYARYAANLQNRINYWGYTKANYFVPKAAYSSGNNPVKSFKDMVKALHINNIEVIMEFYFEEDTNPNLIIDCIKYWVKEYHIDGVHLSGDVTPVTVLATMPCFSHIKIMAENFELNKIYPKNKVPKYKNLAEHNDMFLIDARRFLKGDEDQLNQIASRICKNEEKCASINYIAHHNGFNLMDMVSFERKHNEENGENNKDGTDYNYSWNCGVEGSTRKKGILEIRKKQIKNALILLFLSQGVPNIHSGDEMGHSQKGNNNPYCQDNEITWLNWEDKKKNSDIFEFTKMLIQLRKRHSILHSSSKLKIMDYLSCGYPDLSYHGKRAWYPEFESYNRQIAILYNGMYAKNEQGQEDDFIYIAYNMYWEETEFALPNLPNNKKWRVIIDTSSEKPEESEITQRLIKAKERSIIVLIGK